MEEVTENMITETETKIEAWEKKDEIKRVAKALRTRLERLGYKLSQVHHSPISNSIYYKVTHTTDIDFGETEIRISDHESHSTKVLDVQIGRTEGKSDKAVDDLVEDMAWELGIEDG